MKHVEVMIMLFIKENELYMKVYPSSDGFNIKFGIVIRLINTVIRIRKWEDGNHVVGARLWRVYRVSRLREWVVSEPEPGSRWRFHLHISNDFFGVNEKWRKKFIIWFFEGSVPRLFYKTWVFPLRFISL